ncbi:lyase family protein [Microbacterium sp. P05]|uniref:lyase family protein n=1 Tax=Microbacterium sp. P05 TaxID=3366948 RepID=UPI0037458FE4
MPSDAQPFDVGLLSPVSAGHDAAVSDAALLDALVAAEVALVRAMATVGAVDTAIADEVSVALGWREAGGGCEGHGLDPAALAAAAVASGNPVVPLVALLRERVPERARPFLHRGATSQDILDNALLLIARASSARVLTDLRRADVALTRFADEHLDLTAAARTLTQHAVPTTVGARAATWVRGIRRAIARLDAARAELPVQLGGAAGTLASFVADLGADRAAALPAAYAAELDLRPSDAPWQTNRWPITELGDALVQSVDALGVLAADVATLSRTEIAELSEAVGGASSAMPQKANPVASVLIRSAAMRAPQLGATLHLAASLTVDERPDGAWHVEWPTLREVLRLASGAAAHAADLAEGLRVHPDAVARNLALTGGLIVSERLAIVLVPLIGRERFAGLIRAASDGGDLAALVAALPETAGLDLDELLDPAAYTGLARQSVDRLADHPGVSS